MQVRRQHRETCISASWAVNAEWIFPGWKEKEKEFDVLVKQDIKPPRRGFDKSYR